jgi:hypothetical protein
VQRGGDHETKQPALQRVVLFQDRIACACKLMAGTSLGGLPSGSKFTIILVLVVLALPTGEAAPHPFGGFVEAGVIVLASKIAQSPSLFAEHRVLTSPAAFMHCDQLTHAIHHLPWHSRSTSLTHHSRKTVPLRMSPGLGYSETSS